MPVEPLSIGLVLIGALFAGFVSGFAGFGTGLAASGFWFLALPSSAVPPLIILTSIVGQVMGLARLRQSLDWHSVRPYLIGGLIGLPLGIVALRNAQPGLLRTTVGVFLIIYALVQLSAFRRFHIGSRGGRVADTAVGGCGGFLAGFVGLPGPVPLVWLQLRGGTASTRRMTYQPFNLVIVSLAGIGMLMAGQVSSVALHAAMYCIPLTLVGTWIGLRVYAGANQSVFETVILILLLLSGFTLVA